jgi:hypothetical protein
MQEGISRQQQQAAQLLKCSLLTVSRKRVLPSHPSLLLCFIFAGRMQPSCSYGHSMGAQ